MPPTIPQILKLLSSKWTLAILYQLCSSPKRFNQLEKSLPGISPRTLSQRLKQLEKENIVKRRLFAQVPPRVEYSLTPKGQTLKQIIVDFADWSQKSATAR